MTSCPHPTTRASGTCKQCAVEEQFDGVEFGSDAECPVCGGPTSGEGTVCYKCRGDGDE